MATPAAPGSKLPPAGKSPVHFLLPPTPRKRGEKPTVAATGAGLFVLWAAVALDTDQPSTPADFKLGFCSIDGTLFDFGSVQNPWPLAIKGVGALGKNAAVQPELWSPQKYDVVLIAHPSPVFAKTLLARFQAGQAPNGSAPKNLRTDWRIQTVTPTTLKGHLVVNLPIDPAIFIPGGPPEFGGFLLYRLMPYQTQPVVLDAGRKLVFMLARLRYPAACGALNQPYVDSEAEHSGAFDTAVQASLHRFQKHLAAGQAFQLTAAAVSQRDSGDVEKSSWAYLLGSAVTDKVVQTDPGVADASIVAAANDWFTRGLRKPGDIATKFQKFWARPELWTSFVALDSICQEFKAVYRLRVGSSFRNISANGKGQIEQSFHKIGAAVDLDATLGDASDGMPLGFEGDWVAKTQLDWLVYIHSRESAVANASVPISDKPVQDTTAFLSARLGPGLTPDAQAFLTTLQARLDTLKATATAKLKADLFRDTISRFQWQSGQDDGGDAQTAIDAATDAQRNTAGSGAQGWVNVSRHAFHVGLFRIAAHDGKFVTSNLDKLRRFVPGGIAPNFNSRSAKALELDDLAESIRLSAAAGKSVVVAVQKGRELTVPASSFDLGAVGSWLARTSDRPDVLANPPPSMSVSNQGIDLTITVPLRTDPLFNRFMSQRAAVPITVLSIGDGIQLAGGVTPQAFQTLTLVGDVQNALIGATAVPGKTDRTVVLRPTFAPALAGQGDPGTFEYQVPELSNRKELEWWHFELLPTRAGLFWSDLADDFGLDQAVMEAKDATPTDTGPIFVGGGNMNRPSRALFATRQEPQNQVKSLVRPS